MKIYFLLATLLLVTSCGDGNSPSGSASADSTASAETAPQPLALSNLFEIAKEFSDDRTAATQRYSGKRLKMRGVLLFAKINNEGEYEMLLVGYKRNENGFYLQYVNTSNEATGQPITSAGLNTQIRVTMSKEEFEQLMSKAKAARTKTICPPGATRPSQCYQRYFVNNIIEFEAELVRSKTISGSRRHDPQVDLWFKDGSIVATLNLNEDTMP